MRGALTPARTARVVEGSAADILAEVRDPDVALAIWRRRRPAGFADWLDAVPAERLPEGSFVCAPDQAPSHLETLCHLVGLHDPRRRLLIDDVVALVEWFAAIARAAAIEVRLEAVDHDSCWRFHRDHVGLRLNATYRGPGTQWPPLGEARRASRAQRRYAGPLNEIAPYSVALFKGVPLAGDRAVLHRSPPVEGGGVTRLFLCIDCESAD